LVITNCDNRQILKFLLNLHESLFISRNDPILCTGSVNRVQLNQVRINFLQDSMKFFNFFICVINTWYDKYLEPNFSWKLPAETNKSLNDINWYDPLNRSVYF
jgi:hypothetical protein